MLNLHWPDMFPAMWWPVPGPWGSPKSESVSDPTQGMPRWGHLGEFFAKGYPWPKNQHGINDRIFIYNGFSWITMIYIYIYVSIVYDIYIHIYPFHISYFYIILYGIFIYNGSFQQDHIIRKSVFHFINCGIFMNISILWIIWVNWITMDFYGFHETWKYNGRYNSNEKIKSWMTFG